MEHRCHDPAVVVPLDRCRYLRCCPGLEGIGTGSCVHRPHVLGCGYHRDHHLRPHAGRRRFLLKLCYRQYFQSEAALRINASEQNEVSASSEEGEVISTIAIATSSIVTTIIIVIGVVCIVPLTPILEAPVLEPAFAQMLPALFGGLGVAFVSKNWKVAVAPVVLMLVLFIFVPALDAGTVGIMVPVSVLFTITVARVLYKRGVL